MLLLFSFENVYRQYLLCRKNKRRTINALQFEALKKKLSEYDIKLVTNQIHLNIIDSTHIDNGNTYYLQGEEIIPMLFSPIAGGEIYKKGEYKKKNRRNRK